MLKKKLLLCLCLLMLAVTGIAYAAPGVEVSGGLTLSGTGGLVFPDGTVQNTAGTPTWHQILPAAERFQLVMGNEAVLDRETGLVWAQAPDATTRTWDQAVSYCYQLNLGNRSGWRLPTITEAASLLDKSVVAPPKLPSGHPFSNIQIQPSGGYYWASTVATTTTSAWTVNMSYGDIYHYAKTEILYAWCVRSGQ